MRNSSFQTDSEKIRLINYRVYETNLARIFQILENAGYEPILIKGWAAAQYYPKPWNRNIGDIDLVFRPEKIDKNIEKLVYENTKISFDKHSGFRLLDTVSMEDIVRNCRWENCMGTPIRVLRPEDHLRVLCVHWMIDGGASREKLWDIFHLIEKNRTTFDWQRCLGSVSPKRRAWIETVVEAAHIYLGLETGDLPFETGFEKRRRWVRRTIEKEWKSSTKLHPLGFSLKDRRLLVRQILKRIPPNPIQAAVEMNSEIDGEIRLHYQIMNIFKRLKPSIGRFFGDGR